MDQWSLPITTGTQGGPAWVEVDSDHPDWVGHWFRVTFDDGQVVGLEIRTDGTVLTARKVQRVPFGAIERVARERIREWMTEYLSTRSEAAELFNPTPADWYESHTGGPRDLLLAGVAKRYVETLGDPDQRTKLAEELGYSWEYVPNLLGEARKRGLLSKTVRGRSGGWLLPKATEILAGRSPVDPVELFMERYGWPRAQAASVVAEYRAAGMLDEVVEHMVKNPPDEED